VKRGREKERTKQDVLLATVLTDLIRFTTFAFTLAGSLATPNPASTPADVDVDSPMRARKRSSERTAMALRRRTETACELPRQLCRVRRM